MAYRLFFYFYSSHLIIALFLLTEDCVSNLQGFSCGADYANDGLPSFWSHSADW